MTGPEDEGPKAFDVCGPLPGPGVTLLEASAGTGKTFTIAALVARLVAEGVASLSEILAVTFTRMATGELRDRVRARLVSAEEGLSRPWEAPAGDSVLAQLAQGTPAEVEQRRRRLSDALAGFDAATITTTHGFCQLVLASLGVHGEVAEGAALLEDPHDLVEEVVDDLFVQGVLHWRALPFRRKEALEVGRQAVANPGALLQPGPTATPSGLRARLAQGVRKEVRRRLLDANLLTYDDLLVRLKATLTDEKRGEAACARLRERYRVVLVDEFQDTDPVQWEVVRRAFATGSTTLVLIGDPKQAVYAFRGADVYAYLAAAQLAEGTGGRRFTLRENWRSDQALLMAYDALFNPLNFGHPGIPYRRVSATPSHLKPGLEGAPVSAALRVRMLHTEDHRLLGVPTTKYGDFAKPSAVEWVAHDLASDLVALLRPQAQLVRWGPEGAEASRRRVQPRDVAVLVRTNEQARTVQQALHDVGVPAVLAGTDSVFTAGRKAPSPAALAWLRLMEALEQPASRPRAVAVALTPFIGMSAKEVVDAREETWEDVHSRLNRWATALRRYGTATLFRAMAAEGLTARVLGREGGERELTDLGHLAELLYTEGPANQPGPSALRAWLARRTDEASEYEGDAEERSRRLETDAEAVQVLTVHRAKGLQFPVVYCPYLWDSGWRRHKGGPVVFHDPADGGRKLDVGADEGDQLYDQHYQLHCQEERGEDLRQLYVALTRARHQAVIWWARAWGCKDSPLGRLLMLRGMDGEVPTDAKYTPKDKDVHDKLLALAGRAPGCVSIERCSRPRSQRWTGLDGREVASLGVAQLHRDLDLRWSRTSYSAITSGAHGATGPQEVVGSEPEGSGTVDEPAVGVDELPALPRPAAEQAPLQGVPCIMGPVPGGREVGTFVHRVLARADFAAEDLDGELVAAVGAEWARRPPVLADAGTLVDGLRAAICTPLSPLAAGLRLRDVRRTDRLDELAFELPLAGGDQAAGEVLMADLSRLFARCVLPGSTLASYAARLGDPLLATGLRGYLTGSLDLVFRSGGPGDVQRFFVADYKTNLLAREGEALSAWHYHPVLMEAEMCRAHYPLQALFYLVALHRYLRWRLPGYRPEENLGGALYLFVRGMLGPATPLVDGQACGVFSWRPAASLVTGLSDLLDTGPDVT